MTEDECVRAIEDVVRQFRDELPGRRLILALPPPTRNNCNSKIKNTCERIYDHVNGKVDLNVDINSFSGANGTKS